MSHACSTRSGASASSCNPERMDATSTSTEQRDALVERLFSAALGFDTVEVLPLEHESWRFYRLTVSSPSRCCAAFARG